MELTKEEVEQYFRLQNKVKAHARNVAELCTKLCRREVPLAVNECEDGCVSIPVWSLECGTDIYYFPKEYLSMSLDEVRRDVEKKENERKEQGGKLEEYECLRQRLGTHKRPKIKKRG